MTKHIPAERERWTLVLGTRKEFLRRCIERTPYASCAWTYPLIMWERDGSIYPFPPKGWQMIAIQAPDWHGQAVIAFRVIEGAEPIHAIDGDDFPRVELVYGIEARMIFSHRPPLVPLES